jgi:RNA 2',3'-cyclic 3'-phosphodiesterase
MPRLFVAIDFPDAIIEKVADLCHGVRGAKWVPQHQFHLTVRFIGDVDDATYHDVVAGLDEVRANPFALRLSSVGYFPPHKPPRVLWVGVEKCPDLDRLFSSVEDCLEAVGVERDPRKFHPHVTLARLHDNTIGEDVIPFLSANNLFSAEPVEISEFNLYSSQLTRQGAVHTLEAHYPLE